VQRVQQLLNQFAEQDKATGTIASGLRAWV